VYNPENRRTLSFERDLMTDIVYIDRLTKEKKREKIYGGFFINLLYGTGFFSYLSSLLFLPLFARLPFFSYLYGWFQKSSLSRSKIRPFIANYAIDSSEFLEPIESFRSFNDFFIRKLKSSARPLAEQAILPADGRYLVYPDISQIDGFVVKSKKFQLDTLLQDAQLTQRYQRAGMVIARLCPVDYHRFHFACDCTPEPGRLINGPLYSVNPIALKKNINYLSENKRMMTPLKTQEFGQILYIEVGATYVGSIVQTHTPNQSYAKGAEKGYFEFGGSCLILLFEPNTIRFDQDLIDNSAQFIETRGLLGQSLGSSI